AAESPIRWANGTTRNRARAVLRRSRARGSFVPHRDPLAMARFPPLHLVASARLTISLVATEGPRPALAKCSCLRHCVDVFPPLVVGGRASEASRLHGSVAIRQTCDMRVPARFRQMRAAAMSDNREQGDGGILAPLAPQSTRTLSGGDC